MLTFYLNSKLPLPPILTQGFYKFPWLGEHVRLFYNNLITFYACFNHDYFNFKNCHSMFLSFTLDGYHLGVVFTKGIRT